MTIFGWDASDFDWDRGPMDLGAARAAGIDFFTHKATEGTEIRHRHYGETLERARAAGVPFLGAYTSCGRRRRSRHRWTSARVTPTRRRRGGGSIRMVLPV
jgi:hypothetical protein